MKAQTMQHNAKAMDVQPQTNNQKENRTMKTQLRIASLSLLAVICLTLAALPASANLYDNGPINGTINAYSINFGYTVSNSFQLIAASNTVTSFSFGVWLPTGDVLSSVDWSMTSQRDRSCKWYRQRLRPNQCISIQLRRIRHL